MFAQTSQPSVSNTILKQLGGSRFCAMTGAKMFSTSGNDLSFRIPSAKNGINHIKILLDFSDTYTITFGRVHGTSYKVIIEHSNVYVDNLVSIFQHFTGLATYL